GHADRAPGRQRAGGEDGGALRPSGWAGGRGRGPGARRGRRERSVRSPRLEQAPGASASLVVRGARILDPAAGLGRTGDLVGRDGVIGGPADGLEPVDGEGCVVVPGFVDAHCHLRTPGREDLEDVESGSRSAAAGGYVAIVAMPNTQPVIDTAAVLGALFE